MKTNLSFILVLILCIGAGLYYDRSDIAALIHGAHKPCSSPIIYSIGTFDPGFGISQADFLADVSKAVQIWDQPFNANFFEYAGSTTAAQAEPSRLSWLWNMFSSGGASGDSTLTINLIYDNRQQTTDTVAVIGSTIDQGKASFDSLQSQYNSLTDSYNTEKADLDSLVTAYDSDKDSYNQQVDYWNAQGGAPQSQYASLSQEQAALDSQADTINQDQTSLNSLATTINSTANAMNALATKVNSSVTQYNTVGSAIGEQFQEGEYVQDPQDGNHIDIYQFSDQEKLIRVLAHELGHSLGLGHVTDPQAIMYALNNGAGLALTDADKAELEQVCGISPPQQ